MNGGVRLHGIGLLEGRKEEGNRSSATKVPVVTGTDPIPSPYLNDMLLKETLYDIGRGKPR